MQPECHADTSFPPSGRGVTAWKAVGRRGGAAHRRFRLLAGAALAANALELAGVYSDVAWHHARGRETFWTPPHVVIYAGAAAALLAGIATRGPWLYPALVALLGAWVLEAARRCVRWWWAGTAAGAGYALAAAVRAARLP